MSAHPTGRAAPWLTPSRKGHLAVFAGAACVSFAALFVQGASIDSSMVAFYRQLFGGSILFVIAAWQRERLLPAKTAFGLILFAGALFSGDLLTWHASIVRLGPGLATIIGNFQVFFLALYGVFFMGEALSWRHKVAMPLALFGLALLLDVNPANLPPHILSGLFWGIIAALFIAAYMLALRKTQTDAQRLSPIPNMAWVSLCAALVSGLFCAGSGISFAIPDLETAATLVGLGFLCQSIGWLLLSIGLPHLPPSRAGLIMLGQPALAFLWDILFCGRVTSLTGYTGAAITIAAIGLGLAAPQKKPKKAEDNHA